MKLHQDSRPMDIDQDHIFVDKTMGVKKALDETKNDFADRTPGNPTAERPIGPLWLRVIKGLAVCVLVLFLLDLLVGSGWHPLITPAVLWDSVIIAVSAAVILYIHLIQRHIRRNSSST